MPRSPRWAAPLAAATLAGAVAVLGGTSSPDPVAAPTAAATAATGALSGTVVQVATTPTCTCCDGWISYLKDHQVAVEVRYVDGMTALKDAAGVPAQAGSCHTSEVAGYTVEGHVPLEALDELVTKRPDVDGIALGGMPEGSPGMPGTKTAPLEVIAFTDGGTKLFGSY